MQRLGTEFAQDTTDSSDDDLVEQPSPRARSDGDSQGSDDYGSAASSGEEESDIG